MYRALPALLLLAAPAAAQTITVTGGPADAANVVVRAATGPATFVATADGSTDVPAQAAGTDLVFVLPKLPANATLALKPRAALIDAKVAAFAFAEEPGQHVDLLFGPRKVLRYMNAPRDGTTKDTHELTFKPFHHVFDPATGTTLLTNGAGLAADKALLFPHHRGLFFAFNKINTGDKQESDTWHGRNGEYTLHEKMVATDAGHAFARHVARLGWHGRDGKKFATEDRGYTVYQVPGGTLIDFDSRLTTDRPKVKLDGDPQHAGFHFRAAMEVATKTKAETYYLRPDGKDAPGKTRNWDPKTKMGPVNLPWNAMSFVVGGTRYTVLRLDHPDNPKEARGSERDYGRFGDYFEYELTPAKPLALKYRVWVQAGEMTVAQCEAMSRGFASPPAVVVK